MRTYKKGISLIVLVITVLVLAILATTVIVSLSNTNIIENAKKTTFKSDMAAYKEVFELYVAGEIAETNGSFDRTTIATAELPTILGENLSDKYKSGLKVSNGKLVYDTEDEVEKAVLTELGMIENIGIQVGDKVNYHPSNENASISYQYDSYSNKQTGTFTTEPMEWIYLGKDKNDNMLLTSAKASDSVMYYNSTSEYSEAATAAIFNINTVCKNAYSNSLYGEARSINAEDIARLLNKEIGAPYYNEDNVWKTYNKEITLHQLLALYNFTNCYYEDRNLISYSYDTAETLTTVENILFTKLGDGELQYLVASEACRAYFSGGSYSMIEFGIAKVNNLKLEFALIFDDAVGPFTDASGSLRPVVTLNSNVKITKKIDGVWQLDTI